MRLETALALLARSIESREAAAELPGGMLTGPGGHPPAVGLEVYRNNHRGARERALRDPFPVCRAILGEACFAALARTWVAETPSCDGDLNHHGEGFPAWLGAFSARRPEFSGLPYLGELARLEWARHAALEAAQTPALDFRALGEALARGAPVRLTPAPSLGLLVTRWPVRRILALHLGGSMPRNVEPLSGPERLAVWRSGGEVRTEALSRAAWRLLRGSCRGRSLERIAGADPEVAADLSGLLATAVRRGWLTGPAPEGPGV